MGEYSKNTLAAQLENAEETLRDLEVKSPISGIVAERNIEAGEITGAGLPSFEVVNIDTVYLEVNIPEKYINKIAVGQKVNVEIEAAGSSIYKGTVNRISPVADKYTHTYTINIEIENKDRIIKGGMFARAEFEFEKRKDVIAVPRNVFKIDGELWTAYCVENEVVKAVNITPGIDNGHEVEVISGLEEGDLLMVKGREYVKEGEKVLIVNNN